MVFGPYSMLIDFALISVLLFIGQMIRAKVKWVQNLYLPTAIIAGFMALFLGSSFLGYIGPAAAEMAIPFSTEISSYPYLLIVVLFASLYIGNSQSQSLRSVINRVGDTFAINMAAEFGGFGFALLVGGLLLFFIVPELSSTFAILQPAGFIGGHGYAAAIGTTLEEANNSIWAANNAVVVGQTFATIGILCGIFGGITAIKYATHKQYTRFVSSASTVSESVRTGFIQQQDQQPLGNATISPAALDPLTWHALLILIATAAGYFLYHFFRDMFPFTLPMLCLSMLSGVVLQKTLGVMKLQHTVDKQIINRIGSSVTDYLVAFGIASIKISVVIEYALPILLLAVVGFIFPIAFLFLVSKRLFHNYWFERGIFIFGWSTGVVAMGVTLLRIVDPHFKSKALDDYGIAYLFISMVEIVIVSTLPSVVAISFISGSFWYTLIPGAIMLTIALTLLIVTAKRYGIQSRDGAALRVGEEERASRICN